MDESLADLSDEALTRLIAETRATIPSVATSTKEVYDRVQRFSDLYEQLPVKPTGAALLCKNPATREPESFPVTDVILVGRLSKSLRCPDGCDLALPDSQLSRRHFNITQTDGLYLLGDLDSQNRTFVNDRAEPVRISILKSGDLIFAGRMVFSFVGI